MALDGEVALGIGADVKMVKV
ncbi:MAG: hypothetical protein K0S14_3636, partial [Thermomicrobiales bacterium]|nr:hypothetical protein [Thermomicrobiales bacterium]